MLSYRYDHYIYMWQNILFPTYDCKKQHSCGNLENIGIHHISLIALILVYVYVSTCHVFYHIYRLHPKVWNKFLLSMKIALEMVWHQFKNINAEFISYDNMQNMQKCRVSRYFLIQHWICYVCFRYVMRIIIFITHFIISRPRQL